jgi:hypothetical protein
LGGKFKKESQKLRGEKSPAIALSVERNESFDDVLSLIGSIDEQLFPSKPRSRLIQLDVPVERLPYIPAVADPEPAAGFFLTAEAFLDFFAVPVSNLELELRFIVDQVYASARASVEFVAADFALGASQRLWSPGHVAAILGALTYADYFHVANFDHCPHFDDPVVVQRLAELLGCNASLHTVSFRHTALTTDGIVALSAAIVARVQAHDVPPSPIVSLSLDGVRIDERGAVKLAQALPALGRLSHLSLECQLTGGGARAVVSALLAVHGRRRADSRRTVVVAPSGGSGGGSDLSPRSAAIGGAEDVTSMSELMLRGAALGDATSSTLAAYVVGAKLRELDLADSRVDMLELGPALMTGCPALTRLDLSGCLLRDHKASELLVALVQIRRNSLMWLNVSRTKLPFDGLYAILATMPANSTLIARALGFNARNLTQEGSRRQVGAPRTAELATLDLSENPFGDSTLGLFALGRMLGGLVTLRTLLLVDIMPTGKSRSRRHGTMRGDIALADVARNPAIASPRVRAATDAAASASPGPPQSPRPTLQAQAQAKETASSSTPASALMRLARGLMHVQDLDMSCVSGRPLGDDAVSLIGWLVSNSIHLRSLNVAGQQIGDVGVMALAHGLMTTRSLRALSFDGSYASLQSMEFFVHCLRMSPVRAIGALSADIGRWVAGARSPADHAKVDTLMRELFAAAPEDTESAVIARDPVALVPRAPRQFGAPLDVVMRVTGRAVERLGTSSSMGGTMRASSTALLLAQKQSAQFQLPMWLSDLFNIVRRGRDVEGIFRLSCSSKEREALVHRIDDGDWQLDVPGAPSLDLHVCANTLKHFLRALPELPCTPQCVSKLREATKASSATRFVLLRAAIGCLPEPNRLLMQRLMLLLSEVAASEASRMTAENLSIVFAPSLLWRPKAAGSVDGVNEAQDALTLLITSWLALYRSNVVVTSLDDDDDDGDNVAPPPPSAAAPQPRTATAAAAVAPVASTSTAVASPRGRQPTNLAASAPKLASASAAVSPRGKSPSPDRTKPSAAAAARGLSRSPERGRQQTVVAAASRGKSPSPQRKPTAAARGKSPSPPRKQSLTLSRPRTPSPPRPTDSDDEDVDVESFSRTFGVINVRSSSVFAPPMPHADDDEIEVVEPPSDDVEAVMRELEQPPMVKSKTIHMPIVIERQLSSPTLAVVEVDTTSRESFMPPPPTDDDSDSDNGFPAAPPPASTK